MWCIAGDVWKYVCDYSAYLGGSARATQRQKNVFEFIQETIPSGPVSKPHHTDEATWSQTNNSAQNEATNENDSQTGAPAKKTAQKGATSSDKNENSDTEEATWNQTDNSAQNDATNENDSLAGAQAKKTAQKGATDQDEAKSTTAQRTAQSLDNMWSKSYIRVEITSPIGLSVLCLLSQMLANAEAHLLVQCK